MSSGVAVSGAPERSRASSLSAGQAAAAAQALGAGDFERSAALYRALLRTAPAGSPDERQAEWLEGLGEALRQLERLADSDAALRRALTAYGRLQSPSAVSLARTHQRLAAVLVQLQQIEEARRELNVADALLRPRHGALVERAAILELFGDLSHRDGRYDQAESWYRRAAAEAEEAAGPSSVALASALRNQANALRRLGRAGDAAPLMRRAIEIAGAVLPHDHPELIWLFNDAANLAWAQGDYSAARREWESALGIVTRRFGPTHARAATMLNNLALLANHFGDPDAAIDLEQRALAIWTRDLGPTHLNAARALQELAAMHASLGHYRQARAMLEGALRIRVQRLEANHVATADTHLDLAKLAIDRGEWRPAEVHVSAAERVFEAPDNATHLDRQAVWALRAELAWHRGALDDAEAGFRRVTESVAHTYGDAHPKTAQARAREAEIALARGHYGRAAQLALDAETAARGHLRLAMRDLAERLALSYEATRPPAFDVLLSAAIASGDARLTDTVSTELARSRAQVFDELVERRRPRGDLSAAEARLRDAYQAARSRWANIALRGPSSAQDARYEKALAAARDAVDAAEQALGEESAELRRTRDRKEATVDDIRAALPEGAALVSFVRYGRRVPLPPRPAGAPPVTPPAPVPAYVAIVTSRTAPPVLVDLGDAASLDRLVATWRAEAARGVTKAGRTPRQAERAYRQAGAALRARIWDPLTSHVTGATRILVVPDGALQAVAFAPLPVGTDRYLADGELAFHYLTTERDVMRPAATEHAESSLLAVGGVDFGGTRIAAASAPAAAPASGATRAPQSADVMRLPINADGCLGFDEIEFPALPATAQEAREVEQMWRATGGTALRLSGGQARERRIRELAPRQRMLHFATHGFFLDSTCAGTVAGTRSVRKRVRPGDATPAPPPPVPLKSQPAPARRPVNPLALSGLAFANANSHASTTRGEDDGVLTAEEVAALDLQGVEWVVLSACDTGLGPIRAREGVLGLRRAFEVAGARTVIMSLWSVEDRTTRLWMRELYRSRLQGQRETIDSMRDANRAMLQARRAAGATTHPYYWAGFVAIGDWR